MAGEIIGSIHFLWWNTSLSPPGSGSRTNDAHLKFVVEQLQLAREAQHWDVVGLAEVNSSDVADILKALGDQNLNAVTMSKADSRAVNDTAVIYDRTKLLEIDDKSMYVDHETGTHKTGHLIKFVVLETRRAIYLVVAHWPSRRTMHELDAHRHRLGSFLKECLKEYLESNDPHVVIMGDFNDDPFSPSLSQQLLATRDRTLAKKKKTMFYNPFWRKLGESSHEDGSSRGACGTHYYEGGKETKWFTFDQIIYSSSFLTSAQFELDEASSQILNLPSITNVIQSSKSIFDHYPVSGRVFLRNAL